MADPKPEAKIVAKIIFTGDPTAQQRLLRELSEQGYLRASKEVQITLEYFFETDALAARERLTALLEQHRCVSSLSKMTLTSSKFIAATLATDDDDDDEDEDETPMERAIRESSPSIERVTLSTGKRSVTLTAETARNADQMLARDYE